MSKREEIIKLFNDKLFSNKLDPGEFLKKRKLNGKKARLFECKDADGCGVDPQKHPIWTPALGDENTAVMVVGEAPSATGGLGVHIGGLFEQWEDDPKSPVTDLRDWVKDNFGGKVPYFTDLAKCGVANQRYKGELKPRIRKCMEHFLIQEIILIKPETILCMGKTAYDSLLESEKENRIKVDNIVWLTHYARVASWPLNIEDKKNIIWEWEAGFLTDEELKEKLFELSYFKAKKGISESR